MQLQSKQPGESIIKSLDGRLEVESQLCLWLQASTSPGEHLGDCSQSISRAGHGLLGLRSAPSLVHCLQILLGLRNSWEKGSAGQKSPPWQELTGYL